MIDSDNLARVFTGLRRAYTRSARPGKWSTAPEVSSWTQSGHDVPTSLEILVKKGLVVKKVGSPSLLYRPADGLGITTGGTLIRGGRDIRDRDTRGRSDRKTSDRRTRPDDRRSDRKTDNRGKTPEERRREAERKAARDRQNAAMMSIMLDGSAPISSSATNIARTVR